jgi:hypothetical protein
MEELTLRFVNSDTSFGSSSSGSGAFRCAVAAVILTRPWHFTGGGSGGITSSRSLALLCGARRVGRY